MSFKIGDKVITKSTHFISIVAGVDNKLERCLILDDTDRGVLRTTFQSGKYGLSEQNVFKPTSWWNWNNLKLIEPAPKCEKCKL